jgi:hypothetical protein
MVIVRKKCHVIEDLGCVKDVLPLEMDSENQFIIYFAQEYPSGRSKE